MRLVENDGSSFESGVDRIFSPNAISRLPLEARHPDSNSRVDNSYESQQLKVGHERQ